MPRTYRPKEVIKKLKRLGFIEDRQSGSHKIFYNPETKKRAIVAYHIKEIPKGTLSALITEIEITKEEFEKV